jgi:hypothetical protein
MVGEHYNNILDLGSGKTSMGVLLRKFPNSRITGICYPGDNRKLDSIRANCTGKYELIEMDICKDQPNENYDLVLCHLLLGETIKFGNILETMLKSIFILDTKQFCIIDFLEDVDIDYALVKKTAHDYGYTLIKEKIFPKEEPQQFSKYIGENYIGLLFSKE